MYASGEKRESRSQAFNTDKYKTVIWIKLIHLALHLLQIIGFHANNSVFSKLFPKTFESGGMSNLSYPLAMKCFKDGFIDTL